MCFPPTRSLTLLALCGGVLAAGAFAGQQSQTTPRPDAATPNPHTAGGKLFDEMKYLERYDVNKDGVLDRTELPANLRERFEQLDANKDGKLSSVELRKGAALLQPARRPADVLVVLIEMSDCDECCVEELQHFYSRLRKLDQNNDGQLSADELASARKILLGERVDVLIKDLDRDQDGRVSRDEARGYIRKDFERLDGDRDGFVSREEFLRAGAQRPKRAAPDAKRPDR